MLFAIGVVACLLVEIALACTFVSLAACAVVRRLAKLGAEARATVAAAPPQVMSVADHAQREALRRALYDDALRTRN